MRQSAQLKSAIISLLSLEKLVNNATMRYCFTNCMNTVKKCSTIHESIVKLNELKQDSAQLYKWNVLTTYCFTMYSDIIDNFNLVLNNQLTFTHESTEVVHEISDKNECSALSHTKALNHESEIIPIKAKSEKPQNQFSERSETDISPEKHPRCTFENRYEETLARLEDITESTVPLVRHKEPDDDGEYVTLIESDYDTVVGVLNNSINTIEYLLDERASEQERATGRMCKYLLDTLYGKTIQEFDEMSCVEKTDMLCNLSGIIDEIINDLNVDIEAGEYLDITPDGEIEIKPRNWKLSKQAEDCLFGRDKSPHEMLAEIYGFTYADTDSIKTTDSGRSETQESEENNE